MRYSEIKMNKYFLILLLSLYLLIPTLNADELNSILEYDLSHPNLFELGQVYILINDKECTSCFATMVNELCKELNNNDIEPIIYFNVKKVFTLKKFQNLFKNKLNHLSTDSISQLENPLILLKTKFGFNIIEFEKWSNIDLLVKEILSFKNVNQLVKNTVSYNDSIFIGSIYSKTKFEKGLYFFDAFNQMPYELEFENYNLSLINLKLDSLYDYYGKMNKNKKVIFPNGNETVPDIYNLAKKDGNLKHYMWGFNYDDVIEVIFKFPTHYRVFESRDSRYKDIEATEQALGWFVQNPISNQVKYLDSNFYVNLFYNDSLVFAYDMIYKDDDVYDYYLNILDINSKELIKKIKMPNYQPYQIINNKQKIYYIFKEDSSDYKILIFDKEKIELSKEINLNINNLLSFDLSGKSDGPLYAIYFNENYIVIKSVFNNLTVDGSNVFTISNFLIDKREVDLEDNLSYFINDINDSFSLLMFDESQRLKIIGLY